METAERIVRRDGLDEVQSPLESALEDHNNNEETLSDSDEEEESNASEHDPHPTPYHSSGAVSAATHNSSSSSSSSSFPPLRINHEALSHLATHFLPVSHGTCDSITALPGGTYHAIYLLTFEDGWECIARFPQGKMDLHYLRSEVETMRLVKRETGIPVPEVLFVNFNEEHVVGGCFVLMERMRGVRLVDLWEGLGTEGRRGVVGEVAGVVHELAALRFESIGMLKDCKGAVGKILERQYGESSRGIGPFKTMKGYFEGMMDISPSMGCCEECKRHCKAIRTKLNELFDTPGPVQRFCDAPYGLLHYDLDLQNLLFDFTEKDKPPKLTAVLDWDGAATHPLYFIYDHPFFLRDYYQKPEEWETNKLLRKHFVHTLKSKYPEGSQERRDIYDCFRLKSYFLHSFADGFPAAERDHEAQKRLLEGFLPILELGTGSAYERMDWEPDTDSEFGEGSDEESEWDSEEEGDDEGEMSGDEDSEEID